MKELMDFTKIPINYRLKRADLESKFFRSFLIRDQSIDQSEKLKDSKRSIILMITAFD